MTDSPNPPSTGPLAGVRVIDITAVLMGPSATQMLGDLGADVIKIEPPKGDTTRPIGPSGDQQLGPLFLNLNRNKRSLVLDLKAPEGIEALRQLLKTADVLAYNVRPQAMARLGLSYEEVRAVNKRIVYVGMFGFSQRGRYAPSTAFDDLIQAAVGLPHLIAQNNPGGVPRYVPTAIADRSVGLYAFGVISAALYARERSGEGQRVDVPMFETMVPFVMGDHLYGEKYVPAQGTFGYPRMLSPARRPYRTQTGYVCCTIYKDSDWRAFLEVLGIPERYDNDPRMATITTRTQHITELYQFVEDELAKKTTAEWQALLDPHDVPVFPVHTCESLMADPHLDDIGFFREEQHPTLGTIREMAVPSEWHGTPPVNYRPPPRLGEHSEEVLKEAGYSATQIAQLRERGVTTQSNP